MRRRTLLSVCAGAVGGFAGCTGRRRRATGDDPGTATGDPPADGSTSGSTPTPTPTRTSTPTQAPGSRVTVSFDRYQPAVVELATDSLGLDQEGSFLYLSVDASDAATPPAPGEFELRAGGGSITPTRVSRAGRRLYRQYNRQGAYLPESGVESGWLLFDLPDAVGSDPRLVWPGGEWRPDERLRARLTAPTPSLSATFSVPETVPAETPPTVSLTIDNEGDLPARYVAGLNRIGPSVAYYPVASVSTPIDAGETETWEYVDDSIFRWPDDEAVGDGDPDVTYRLAAIDGGRRRTIRIAEG